MPRSLKIIVFTVSGFVGFLALVYAVLFLFVDINIHKPRLEAAASGALGMDVKVGGRLGIGFLPNLHVTLKDVHILNRGEDVVSARDATLGIDFLPLLRKEVRIGKIALKQPIISVVQERNGSFNFEKPPAARGTLPFPDLTDLSLSGGTLNYTDKKSGTRFVATGCSLSAHRMGPAGGKSADLRRNLSFTAEVACRAIRRNDFTMSDVKFAADGRNGIIDLKPVTMRVFGTQGSGSIHANFAGAIPVYYVRCFLPQFHIGEFFKTITPQKVAAGTMDFSANLSMQGKTVHEMIQSMTGKLLLTGENLTLNGSDLDREFARFSSSQNFNLVDVGAFFFAGPFGLAITKGYNFANLLRGSGGSSKIIKLVSEWNVKHGVAQAQDVAMATKRNRIALHGGLDFVSGRFKDVTVALIDDKGCARVQQKITGSFGKPVVEKPSIFKTLTGPVLKLLKKGRELFPGGQCTVFYSGSVAPPK